MNAIRPVAVTIGFVCLIAISAGSQDNLVPYYINPGKFSVKEVPQLIVIGFDDNTEPVPLTWMLDFLKDKKNPEGVGNKKVYDGEPVRVSFYVSPQFNANNQSLKDAVKRAYDEGHEIGNHTKTHPHNYKMSPDWTLEEILLTKDQWVEEINACTDWLKECGVDEDAIVGFRNPFLETSESTFQALLELGFMYDCSLEEGFKPTQNGTNFLWPYTLNYGSPGNKVLADMGSKATIPKIPGFWEVPNYAVIVPPDDLSNDLAFEPGLRDRMHATQEWFEVSDGKVTGFDYNLWGLAAEGAFELKANEVLAILKHTLNLRYNSERAPLMFGAHTQFYSDSWSTVNAPNATTVEMQAAIEGFIDYALSLEDVRIVRTTDIIAWCRNPVNMTPIKHMTKVNSINQSVIGTVTESKIQLAIPEEGEYSLALYSLSGQTVNTIISGRFNKGTQAVFWNGAGLGRKVCLLALKGGKETFVQKIVLH